MNYDLTQEEVSKLEGNPLRNPNAVLLEKQPDGNWRGFMMKNGKLVQERQVDPGTVMAMLITHP